MGLTAQINEMLGEMDESAELGSQLVIETVKESAIGHESCDSVPFCRFLPTDRSIAGLSGGEGAGQEAASHDAE